MARRDPLHQQTRESDLARERRLRDDRKCHMQKRYPPQQQQHNNNINNKERERLLEAK